MSNNVNSIAVMLGKTLLFGTMNESERASAARQMRPASFDAGQLIFSRGDPGVDVHLVTEGRVRLSVLSGEGRELSFNHAGPGVVFGEIAALDGGKRTADATAVGAVKTMVLTQNAMRSLIASSPTLAAATIRMLCSRLREADLQLEAVALHSIEVRLARFLLAQVASQSPGKVGARATVQMDMSQTELALLLGASRPKVNAALALLEAEGAITRRDSQIECAVENLRRLGEVE